MNLACMFGYKSHVYACFIWRNTIVSRRSVGSSKELPLPLSTRSKLRNCSSRRTTIHRRERNLWDTLHSSSVPDTNDSMATVKLLYFMPEHSQRCQVDNEAWLALYNLRFMQLYYLGPRTDSLTHIVSWAQSYLYNNTLKSRDTCPANCVSRDTCPANCVSRDACQANCVVQTVADISSTRRRIACHHRVSSVQRLLALSFGRKCGRRRPPRRTVRVSAVSRVTSARCSSRVLLVII